ncbi:uncharacterized protein LOC125189663 [Salvia hispanica]|uniref:uncharacterized protein LOC125189663 n=1 Tax=Salvia hispanica TaxID=49212 RepID=UPI002009DA90|nr:uncharacterized protein LOC125189663 [Salvia hispanica]
MDYTTAEQDSLDSPMPWIGMYIVAASAVCTLAMAADAFIGFRSKKYWLLCNYFSLNAFSLTVLAVAMKLPIDLTDVDITYDDKNARIGSVVLMSTAMSNFMTSLGAMENNEIVLNMAALGILVITIAGNEIIHLFKMQSSVTLELLPEMVISVVIMFSFLSTLCCMSLMAPGAKRYIGLKYNEMRELVSNRQVEWGRFIVDEVENMVKAYWVMAQTSRSQFVLARSSVSCISGLLFVFIALLLVEARFVNRLLYFPWHEESGSNYGWSVGWILNTQSIGVAMGTIAPLLRWFVASWLKISETERRSFRNELKVEKYWTWRLVEWRDRSLPFQLQNRFCKMIIRDARRTLLNFCIRVQILFVSAGKLVLFLSARLGSAVFLCFCKIKRSVFAEGTESKEGAQVDFRQYVIILEGEPELPYKILKNICNEADKLIKVGDKKQPKNLIQLFKKSSNFCGVGRFDSRQVPSLHSQEPPNCWSLPVVTLTAISVALTGITYEKANQLLVCVSEGLPIVKLIEETLDRTGELENIRKVTDVVWD